MTSLELCASVSQVLCTLRAARYRQDAKAVQPEVPSVDVLHPRRFVGEKFPVEGALGRIAPHHGHRGPIGLQKVERAARSLWLAGMLQTKHTVGHDADVGLFSYVHAPLNESAAPRLFGKGKLVAGQKSRATVAAGEFDGDHYVSDEQGMFKKHAADGAILSLPVNGRSHQITAEEGSALAADSIDERT